VTVWAGISWYSVGLRVTFHGRIDAREYLDRLGNQTDRIIQTLFSNKDAHYRSHVHFAQLEFFCQDLKT
jgi:hypothetical protein